MKRIQLYKFGYIVLFGVTFFLMPAKAEKTIILEEIQSPPNTLDSIYQYEPEITIRRAGTEIIEEHSINGQLYMLKITSENYPTYYLVRQSEGGQWMQMDNNKPLVVPQWVIFSF
jgi:hypothetical protein